MERDQTDDGPRTPFITALLADRDRRDRDRDRGDVSPWPAWAPQADMIPPLDAR